MYIYSFVDMHYITQTEKSQVNWWLFSILFINFGICVKVIRFVGVDIVEKCYTYASEVILYKYLIEISFTMPKYIF